MAPELYHDILVVGGGPAGSAAALRLAQLGHDVCLLERHPFPRPHVGESLSGGARAQLTFLGVADVLDHARPLRFDHARVHWSAEAFACKPIDPNGCTVDRAHFDDLLLGAAQRVGVRVVQPARARAAERRASLWHVNAEANGADHPIRARFIIDASGRSGFLPRQRIETSAKTLALYGYWRGAGLPETPRIEAGARQWYWGSPVPGRGFNAMAFIDRDSRREGRATLRQRYHRLIKASQLLAGADTAELDGGVFGCDATSFEDENCFGDGFLKVGEAAFAIDPLSSSGVQAAIQSALAGAIAVHTMLSRPECADVAQDFYARHVKHAATRHAAWAAQLYAEHRRYAAETFWRERASKAEAVDAGRDAIRRDWRHDDCVSLSVDVRIENVPAAVGDFVVLRPAISHRTLSRPVAFIGGLDLPAFLDRMPPVARVADLEQALSLVLPRDHVPAVLCWLLDRGMLEASESRATSSRAR
jgi:flavin-dependent dehydrogenase